MDARCNVVKFIYFASAPIITEVRTLQILSIRIEHADLRIIVLLWTHRSSKLKTEMRIIIYSLEGEEEDGGGIWTHLLRKGMDSISTFLIFFRGAS